MTRPVVRLPERLRRRIVDHCRAALPNEGCGLLAMDGDVVVEVYPTANLDSSPTSFTISPADHYAALVDAESKGWTLGGVFHSHPRGEPMMSATDLRHALDPDWVYLVVGGEGQIRAWSVEEGAPTVIDIRPRTAPG
jgi:proteasome lid subunit RPN8/RPN11